MQIFARTLILGSLFALANLKTPEPLNYDGNFQITQDYLKIVNATYANGTGTAETDVLASLSASYYTSSYMFVYKNSSDALNNLEQFLNIQFYFQGYIKPVAIGDTVY